MLAREEKELSAFPLQAYAFVRQNRGLMPKADNARESALPFVLDQAIQFTDSARYTPRGPEIVVPLVTYPESLISATAVLELFGVLMSSRCDSSNRYHGL